MYWSHVYTPLWDETPGRCDFRGLLVVLRLTRPGLGRRYSPSSHLQM